MSADEYPQSLPPQHQDEQPGRVAPMRPQPQDHVRNYKGSGKLSGKAAITGGDSGIGRAAAIAFAKEGADVAVVYLSEHDDAADTRREIEAQGVRCLLLAGDIGDEAFAEQVIDQKKTDSSYMTGQVLHPKVGEIING